jgi:hypothetical protein
VRGGGGAGGGVRAVSWWGKLRGRRQLEISQPRWEDNIRVDLKEIVWEGVDRIYLARDRN